MPQRHTADQSTGDLLAQLSDQIARLVRDEVQLAQREVQRKLKGSARGAGALVVGALLAILGAGAVVAFLILLLAKVVPAFLSALIIGAVLLILGGALAAAGAGKLKKWRVPVPEETLASVGRDFRAMLTGAHR